MPLELCTFTPTSLHTLLTLSSTHPNLINRIEYCTNRSVAGLTPDILSYLGAVHSASTSTDSPAIPIHVIIRPRGGDFNYTPSEFSEMQKSIKEFLPHAAGFVFGILTSSNTVDVPRCAELVALSRSDGVRRQCTFHKAFDELVDMERGLEDVISAGFDIVLTSGGKKTALEGREVLRGLVGKAAGRVEIMAGGGIRAADVGQVVEVLGREGWIHSSALGGEGEEVDVEEVRRLRAAMDLVEGKGQEGSR